MTSIELITKTRAEARACPWHRGQPCRREDVRLWKTPDEHLDAHLAAAVEADRRAVAQEAWLARGCHVAGEDCGFEYEADCMDATIKRLAEEGP